MQSIAQSPTDPDFVQNPYPFYDRIRTMGDLVWWQDYGMACATSHQAVHALLRDKRFGREVPAERAPDVPAHAAPFYAVEAHSMLELEPPRHTRLRSLVLRAFTSRRIAELGPEIAQLSHALIDDLPTTGSFDLLPLFAQKLPVIIICRLLGVPEAMSADLLRWSNAMVAMYTARRNRDIEIAAARAAQEFTAYLTGHIAARSQDPRDDLITQLIAAKETGDKLSVPELITTCILVLNAGHEATVHTIGNGVKTLLEHGLRPTHDTSEAIAEEVLRHDPPLHMFTRYAYEDLSLYGHDIKRGDQVALLLACANRDAQVWSRPNDFNPARPRAAHTSFGGGIHFCVGAPLARLELHLALPILFERLPHLQLACQPAYADSYHFHGLQQLLVRNAPS